MDEINGEHNKERFLKKNTNAFDNYVCMFFQASLSPSCCAKFGFPLHLKATIT
jgi:hypothetical protein